METGTQVEAPTGCGSLTSGQVYYFCGCYDEKVLLVWFVNAKHGWRVHCIRLAKVDFECALNGEAPLILRTAVQHTVPPWLWPEGNLDYDKLEERRQKSDRKTYREQAEDRLLKITPALRESDKILAALDPNAAIARVCRKAGIKDHPHRLQTWFFAIYLHPGAGVWALKKPAGRTGTWDRASEKHATKKLGRPRLIDANAGSSTALIKEKIITCYSKRCRVGKSMRAIHADALFEDFGCITTKNKDGINVLIHPENKPFPSYGQFRAVVVKALGPEKVRQNLYGDARIRNSKAHDDGSYKAQVANLLEDLQVDAYYVSERARSLCSSEPMPRLAVVRARCTASGANVGVGFSLEGEAEEAYRAALFCVAVPKELIFRLYGVDSSLITWDMQGLPPTCLSDRGPAGSSTLIQGLQTRFPLKAVTPSYTPKSKAPVESGNPRKVKLEGKPSFVQSDLSVPQLMKRELLEAVRQNHAQDISDRLTNQEAVEFLRRGWPATPQRLWAFRTEQMRTHARVISVEQAVRLFLRPVQFSVNEKGVKFRNFIYSSQEFRLNGVHARLAKLNKPEITGYALAMALMIIWVEVDGKLIELTPHKVIPCDDEEYLISVTDAADFEAKRAALASLTRQAGEAAANAARGAFKKSSGKNWSGGSRRDGVPKRPRGPLAEEARATKARQRKARRDAA